jgi:chromosomal replication initiator protein
MHKPTLTEKWNAVCAKVTTYPGVTANQFTAFLERIHPQVLGEGFLLITVETPFLKNWVEKQYLPYIQQALLEIYGVNHQVMIEVDEPIEEETTIQNAATINAAALNQPQDYFNTAPQTAVVTQTTYSPNVDVFKAEQNPIFSYNSPVQAEAQINNLHNDYPQPLSEETSNIEIPSAEEIAEGFTGSFGSQTFETFVIGDSNRLAYSMAVQVAETPGQMALNPLFIYGKSGLGKTHLLYAIQNYINKTQPYLKTVCTDAEALVSGYTDAVAESTYEKTSYKNFKVKYENADVLLIDDVQFLQGKKQTLDIVFQIFNNLINQGKQIVLSADRAPKNIDIDERYSSRFAQGGTVDIQPPEMETKLGIVKSYINEYKNVSNLPDLEIPEEIQTYIAENSGSNIRELKGAVGIVVFRATHENNVSMESVKNILENNFSGGISKSLTIDDIQKEIEEFYKISHKELIGKSRERKVVYPRQVAMYLCRQLLDLPHDSIGRKFNRDHSTVMHAVQKIEDMLISNRDLQEEVESLKQIIKEL